MSAAGHSRTRKNMSVVELVAEVFKDEIPCQSRHKDGILTKTEMWELVTDIVVCRED